MKLITLCLLLTISYSSASSPVCNGIPDDDKLGCAPDKPNDEKVCVERGCCFAKLNITGPPACFFPLNYVGYKVIEMESNIQGITMTLQRNRSSGISFDVQYVKLEITFLKDQMLRLKFTDKYNPRYEIPFPLLQRFGQKPQSLQYKVDLDQMNKLKITRKSTGKVIFNTDLSKLIYSDQFLQLQSNLPSKFVIGLGEHYAPLKKYANWQTIELWNHDQPLIKDKNLYGSHPFYLSVEDDEGNTNGVLLFNSNAMDIVLQPKPAITWRTIGGILEYYVILGSNPKEVVKNYQHLVGTPTMPPFWSLGFHLCRCFPSPDNIEEQINITQRTIDAKIPFDVFWSAIEFMVDVNDFTLDEKRYGRLPKFVNHLHDIGMHYVQIKEPGISGGEKPGTYAPYDDGVKMDIFVKNSSGQILIGNTWNKSGKTVYIDFTNPNATQYWTKLFVDFHKKTAFDGAWNDMNEISNFKSSGSIYGCPKNSSLEHPPYLPGGSDITHYTICMTAKHHIGVQYNVHNLYPLYQAKATSDALNTINNKRPFIISRSTFIGQGKYSGHWNGDDHATYDDMRWSIPSILNFNIFGIPMVGADICGYFGEEISGNGIKNYSNFQELCARWHELGAFYPFSRNNNGKPIDQDPVALGKTAVESAKNSLEIRYSLLPYLYTLFYDAEAYGETVARPLFFEFPKDKHSYDSETQFLWGSAVMIMPVTEPGVRKLNAYFPTGKWYLYDLKNNYQTIESRGQNLTLDAPLGKINVAIRGGTILPILPPKQTTTQLRQQNFTLLCVLNEKGLASGKLYWDDGDTFDPIFQRKNAHVYFNVLDWTPALTIETMLPRIHLNPLDQVKLLGVKNQTKTVKVNGNEHNYFNYESKYELLTIYNLNVNMTENYNIINWN